MTQRLIDADVLIEKVNRRPIPQDAITTIAIYMACKWIENAPTVEAEPVRHGKWIIRYNPGTEWYRITCSVCDEDVTSTAPCIGFFPNVKVLWDYCPNCGCRMDKDV